MVHHHSWVPWVMVSIGFHGIRESSSSPSLPAGAAASTWRSHRAEGSLDRLWRPRTSPWCAHSCRESIGWFWQSPLGGSRDTYMIPIWLAFIGDVFWEVLLSLGCSFGNLSMCNNGWYRRLIAMHRQRWRQHFRNSTSNIELVCLPVSSDMVEAPIKSVKAGMKRRCQKTWTMIITSDISTEGMSPIIFF